MVVLLLDRLTPENLAFEVECGEGLTKGNENVATVGHRAGGGPRVHVVPLSRRCLPDRCLPELVAVARVVRQHREFDLGPALRLVLVRRCQNDPIKVRDGRRVAFAGYGDPPPDIGAVFAPLDRQAPNGGHTGGVGAAPLMPARRLGRWCGRLATAGNGEVQRQNGDGEKKPRIARRLFHESSLGGERKSRKGMRDGRQHFIRSRSPRPNPSPRRARGFRIHGDVAFSIWFPLSRRARGLGVERHVPYSSAGTGKPRSLINASMPASRPRKAR